MSSRPIGEYTTLLRRYKPAGSLVKHIFLCLARPIHKECWIDEVAEYVNNGYNDMSVNFRER